MIQKTVAVGVVAVLTTSTAQAVAHAAGDSEWTLRELQREKSVDTASVGVDKLPDGPSPAVVDTPAAYTWPVAAQVEVRLDGEVGTDQAAGEPIPVPGTPISLGLADQTGASTTQAGESRVRVEVHDRKASPTAVVFSLADAGGAQGKSLRVALNYGSFASAFGGDYGGRLKLVHLPACALTNPGNAECLRMTPVQGAQNFVVSKRLLGTATLNSSERTVFAVVAAAGSDQGAYSATSLSPAGSWSAGGSSGGFTYKVPMRVPPAVAGAAPSVSLGYSAQSLDGRTSATNNQASWAGDGWDISPGGFIERQYKPCSLDLGGNNGQTKSGDQCWATDNATISLAGVSGKLVNIPGTQSFRAQDDDGARVERLTGAANGDDNGEYWKVTTTDGTQYFLGMNRLPGWSEGKPETQSAWTVPVYGNHGGEPCNAGTFDASWCRQAYRWNVDYSVDPRGNVTTYYYNREFNHYGRNSDAGKGTEYVRGGWLDRVEYGLRDGALFAHPGAKVEFQTAERCLPGCNPGQATTTPEFWPDVPNDQICNAGEQCTHRLTPSFFTRKKLTKVVTYVANGTSSFQAVDSWELKHEFQATGDGLAPSLNLKSVVHTGHVGGDAALPPTVFSYTAKANRVNTNADFRALTRNRLTKIINEAGGQTGIRYSEVDCRPGRMPSSPEWNNLRCFPTWWTPEGALEPRFEWFHKYVVEAVIDTDVTGASQRIPTTYEYLGDPAWHFDEAEFADPERRTWSQWRGYGVVRTSKGDPNAGPQTVTETVYGRGMKGDKLPSGTRDAVIETSEGEPVPDVDRLRGFVRETRQLVGGQIVSASVTDPYLPDTPTATDALGNKAFVTGDGSVRGRTKLEDGTWRRTKVVKQFTAEGIVNRVEDHGDVAVTGDETCTRTTFARNETAWILTAASKVETAVGLCAGEEASAATVQSSARSYYDGQEHGVPPTKGLITKAEVLDKWDASGQTWVTASSTSYDDHGRPQEVVDARGEKTTTAYTPSTGPITEISSTNPLGHVSKEFVNPAWGTSVASVDANNRRADLSHDPLGRLVAAWLPGHDKASTAADALFEYHYNTDKPVVVVSKQRQDNGTYLAGYTLYDGLFRPRQTQAPAPGPDGGRQVSDTIYDSRGLPFKVNGAYWNTGSASGELAGVLDWQVPGQTITEYDGMERPTAAIFKKLGTEQWRTTTAYGGDRVHTTPPQGAAATTIVSDAQGRTTEKRQYTNGLGSAFDTTAYAYNTAGLLSSVTDPAGNVWRYTYDFRGRLVATDDPDTGHSTTTYDVAGQVLSTTDSAGRTVANQYDKLGRLVGKYKDSLTGTKLAEWEYDTAVGGVGLLKTSRRFDGGATYSRIVTGYDAAGRPKGEKVIIPTAREGVLGATYELKQTYTDTGKPDLTTYVGVQSGGKQTVSGEVIASYYTPDGRPDSTRSSNAVYVSQTAYSSFGEMLQMVHGKNEHNAEKNVAVTNLYEIGTRRLQRTIVDRETDTDFELSDRTYGYDAAGNILKISDRPENRPADVQCFAYDHLRRMNHAWTPALGSCLPARTVNTLGGAAPYWHSWTFDKTGNRLTETQHTTAGDTVRTTAYPAAGAAQPHTALSVTTAGPNGTSLDTFGYDPTGRTTSRRIGGDEQRLEYDAEGRVSKVTNADGKESTYLYDADGGRLISREPSATTLHVFGQEIRLDKGTSTPSWTRRYSHGGQVVAVRNSISGLKWLAGDHQGTSQFSISQHTMEVVQRRQTPYGAARGTAPVWPDKLGFVGGRNDESGLTQVGARLYDQSSGRFLTADPVIDNNDPQQLNGYAYANNSPVTFSDPTGLIRDCGPDGVLCGRYPQLHAPKGSEGDRYEAERGYYQWRERAYQQQQRRVNANVSAALAKEGISREDYERALADAHKTKWDVIKEVAWEVLKEISGWNDIVDCFSGGDIWACAGLVAGLVPWGKVGKILEAGVNAFKAVNRLAGIIDKAKGVLRRVQSITEDAQRAATEAFQKLSPPGADCVRHSFVGKTSVLMADGSTKPIAEVAIGDKVKATDPATGETTERAVVATIVHSDEGDMTRLTVTGSDGATGTVEATSWHPVWVDAESRFVDIGKLTPGQRLTSADGTQPTVSKVDRYHHFKPVYDLTVDGIHTYYVAADAIDILVHNCRKPGHTVDVDVLDGDGEVRLSYSVGSGNPSDAEKALGGGYNTEAATHTENRVARMSGASSGKSPIPGDQHSGLIPVAAGESVHITGQLPPCFRCRGAMNRMVNELGASVTYSWNGPRGSGQWIATGGRRR
ncbi:polymorphic toxin-type HINT domain-containing protein [Saccharothrix australiensis]|uniref:polymorphic toxin-type HINT domain-containing protein n=1 Tax=Saccharothrix australiensis TaxID=2072 RepID=UPI0011C3E5F8|nr:polymorphic toxin-type HINT domain-containing protein [Saccharothrix australiensis]